PIAERLPGAPMAAILPPRTPMSAGSAVTGVTASPPETSRSSMGSPPQGVIGTSACARPQRSTISRCRTSRRVGGNIRGPLPRAQPNSYNGWKQCGRYEGDRDLGSMTMLQQCEGGCHCGRVRFRARVDLDLLSQCNCSIFMHKERHSASAD